MIVNLIICEIGTFYNIGVVYIMALSLYGGSIGLGFMWYDLLGHILMNMIILIIIEWMNNIGVFGLSLIIVVLFFIGFGTLSFFMNIWYLLLYKVLTLW